MTTAFNSCDPGSWPVVLTAEQVAAIYQRSVGGVKKKCQEHTFVPAPYQKQPYRWRKADVVRDVEGARGGSLRRVG
jgi:hypothetical protein